ncbi:MAG: hypothetical protein C4520_06850 [Candidatus Abyssobacteria bacterium SURF_5]|uniref:Uncharacterized protein n=1 Tax=Abyssobacteria bacterium (strain SURF_5) TaxID=2093360 RepID=A0A3A4NYC3_ABYX5|nr:MAG: hypothetical protein C4520_06850 [Candidatus Abyssubacteria bacterium SURF_5]
MKIVRVVEVFLVSFMLCFPFFVPKEAAADANQPRYKEAELLIKFKPGVTAEQLGQIQSAFGLETLRHFELIDVYHMKIDGRGLTVADAVESLKGVQEVLFAEPNYIVSIDTGVIPDDPDFYRLWGLRRIEAPEAWYFVTGKTDLVVGVIDTGIDYNHEDLVRNMWMNPGEMPGNGIDDDGNGYIDDLYGIDACNDDTDPYDDHGHGTHCAGTIAAVGDNGIGPVGVCWNIKLMALKMLASNGEGSNADAIECLEYATMMKRFYGIDVRLTSNSWGWTGPPDEALRYAIEASGNQDMLFIAAAGNEGEDNDTEPRNYPSSYTQYNIVAVAATTPSDALSSYSNYGASSVDLGAPGDDIFSTLPGNQYGYSSGTSMATPHVAGAAALLWAYYPDLQNADIKDRLLQNVDPVPSLEGLLLTGGRLNIAKALQRPLTQITLKNPVNESTLLSSVPTLRWSPDGGTSDNVFAVEFSLSPGFSKYWSTYENLHERIEETDWVIPKALWDATPAEAPVYWRIRGADVHDLPVNIITSDQLWSVYKGSGWDRTFGDVHDEAGYSVEQTADGGYILAGFTNSLTGGGGYDILLMKTDANGEVAPGWPDGGRRYGGSLDDFAYSVQQTADGGYVIAGETRYSEENNVSNGLVIKTDSNGGLEWESQFGDISFRDYFRCVSQTSDGGYILTGHTKTFGQGPSDGDVWLVKLDANGDRLWQTNLDYVGDDYGQSVQETTDGGYIIAGYRKPPGEDYDGFVMKTNAGGQPEWASYPVFGGEGDDAIRCITQTADGKYVFVGRTLSFGAGSGDAWLVKLDTNGNKEWPSDRLFGGPENDGAWSVRQTTDGGFVLAGHTDSYGITGDRDVWLIKTDPAGTELWNKRFGGSSADEGLCVQETTDGAYIISGSTASFKTYGRSDSDAWLIKLVP